MKFLDRQETKKINVDREATIIATDNTMGFRSKKDELKG